MKKKRKKIYKSKRDICFLNSFKTIIKITNNNKATTPN